MTTKNQGVAKTSLRMRQVKVSDLNIDEENFLPRREIRYDPNHIHDLAERIKRGVTLDPMTVWVNPQDGELYIIAGHHRLKAYKRRKHKKPIRVRVFEGTLAEARLKASASNIKAVLPLNSTERADTAWWLVTFVNENNGYLYSKDHTAAASGVSKSQVARMRRTHKALLESDVVMPKTWGAAVLAQRGLEDEPEFDEDELVKVNAEKLDAEIGQAITQAGYRCPRALGIVFARRLGDRYRMVLDWTAGARDDLDLDDDDDDDDSFPF